MQCLDCQKLGLKVIASSCPHGRNLYQRADLSALEIQGHRTRTSIRWVSSGEYHYQIGRKKFILEPNRYLVLNNATEYNSRVSRKSIKVKSHTLSFDAGFLASAVFDVQNGIHQKLENPEKEGFELPGFLEHTFPIEGAFGKLLRKLEETEAQEVHSEELFFPLAQHFLGIQTHLHHQMEGISAAKKSTKEELFRRLLNAYDLIMQDPTNTFSTQELATFSALSEFHFLRSFKSAFGISPRQLQNQNKLYAAERLLSTGHFSATEVALKVGFSDVSSFSHAFKKWKHRVSPETETFI